MTTVIRNGEYDILYHWEIGTDAINYFLPFLRLAPVQCTSWAIQVTSGIPTVDHYISSELIETGNAQEHYSEHLTLLKTLLSFQTRVQLSGPPKKREHFGFNNTNNLYMCIQNLRKLHPDFDQVLKDILQHDPNGLIVLTSDSSQSVTRKLQERFQKTIPSDANRIVFLPRQNRPDYLHLLSVADVLLDPIYYGGVNTTYDALSLGKPIVVHPTQFQIGRYTLGCYRKMNFTDCVAQSTKEYVEIAFQLASDSDARESIQDQILEKSENIFEDIESVREHEHIFSEWIHSSRTGNSSN